MKFLADQDVWAATTRFLRSQGHDVVTVSELKLSRAEDEHLLTIARREGRVMITRDRDFGGLVFVKHRGAGVIYLRISPATITEVHSQLQKLLTLHTEAEISNAFVVVEAARYRIRKPKM
jgi:predicted nuclease of predicted toxin-antitoxin system